MASLQRRFLSPFAASRLMLQSSISSAELQRSQGRLSEGETTLDYTFQRPDASQNQRTDAALLMSGNTPPTCSTSLQSVQSMADDSSVTSPFCRHCRRCQSHPDSLLSPVVLMNQDSHLSSASSNLPPTVQLVQYCTIRFPPLSDSLISTFCVPHLTALKVNPIKCVRSSLTPATRRPKRAALDASAVLVRTQPNRKATWHRHLYAA
jgi:hypothetical protein